MCKIFLSCIGKCIRLSCSTNWKILFVWLHWKLFTKRSVVLNCFCSDKVFLCVYFWTRGNNCPKKHRLNQKSYKQNCKETPKQIKANIKELHQNYATMTGIIWEFKFQTFILFLILIIISYMKTEISVSQKIRRLFKRSICTEGWV